MHLAESREELELLADGAATFRELLEERSMWDAAAIPARHRGRSIICGVLAEAPRSLVIHGNYLAGDEIAFLGQRRETMSVVYCPRTHAYFGHEPYPLEAMLAAGVRVALGTDSRASNPDLELAGRDAIRRDASFPTDRRRPRGCGWRRFDAAEALGVGDEVGSLTPAASERI